MGGELVEADGAFDVIEPATGQAFAQAREISEVQLDSILEGAAIVQSSGRRTLRRVARRCANAPL
jgi:acyl-CoA reductase-like NAD-dependent aldehyde dehydrogenase